MNREKLAFLIAQRTGWEKNSSWTGKLVDDILFLEIEHIKEISVKASEIAAEVNKKTGLEKLIDIMEEESGMNAYYKGSWAFSLLEKARALQTEEKRR